MIRLMTAALVAFALGAATLGAQEPAPPGTEKASTVKASTAKASPAKAGPAKASATADAPVNLNTATVTQLETLPGVGTKTAELILEYRQKNGSFKKIEELMNVRGVGEKSFLKMKPLLTVTTPKASPPTP